MRTQTGLMEQLAAPENLLAAWRSVRGNIPSYRRSRSAGPDGVTITEYERDLPAHLNSLRHMLLNGRYHPQAPGRFTITKHNGGERQLAVLNVKDRVAQRAAQQTIEPLYEPNFMPCSYGFRPGRSTQGAIEQARLLRQNGHRWVVDGDVADCFDSLDHNLLISRLNQRIKDRRLLDLLSEWLSAGIMEHGLSSNQGNWIQQNLDALSQRLQSNLALPAPGGATGPNKDYYAAQYETPEDYWASRELEYGALPAEAEGSLRKQAFRQLTAGGILLGTSWARQGLSTLGKTALTGLQTPVGRDVLRRWLLTGGGLLGAAASMAISGYLIYQKVAPSSTGIIQGSPLSPLLANIYLHPFDAKISRAGYRLIRSADDWVILSPDRTSAEASYNLALLTLARLKLKVNTQKTRILSPDDRLHWLGMTIE